MNSYFAVVSRTDDLLFELESFKPEYYTAYNINDGHHQFVAYAALDMVDMAQRTAQSPHLGVVDRVIGPDGSSEWTVSAYLTPSGLRLMLLAEGRPEEAGCKAFFAECHQALLKVLLNPFYVSSEPIRSKPLTERVRAAVKKYLK